MRVGRFVRGVALAAMFAGVPAGLEAQGVHAEVGRFLEADGWTTYRLGIERDLARPVGAALYGIHLRDESSLGRRHWGIGTDLILFRGARSGPYLAGGYAAGFSSDSGDSWWSSWSGGGGVQLLLGGAVALAGEARYRSVSPGRRDGVELSVRLGAVFGRSGGRPRATPPAPLADLPPAPDGSPTVADPTSSPPPAVIERSSPGQPPLAAAAPGGDASAREGPDAVRVALADSVIATALDALGTNYKLGGTTSDGFDCSGLIQHAYARHGIKLPRVSRDQAREGRAVKRDLDALRPGDILTFSQRRGRITHVGLYLGDGRFVHSARRGVQVSTLSASDPYGKWYWKRWIGARRIVTGYELRVTSYE